MQEFARYAIYWVPGPGGLADFGASWLGWDVDRGRPMVQPEVGLPLAALTAAPRRYGLHATIKPPFRLAEGQSVDALAAAAADLCRSLAPLQLDGLELAPLDGFLALVPAGDTSALSALAARIVAGLDRFRAPAPPGELARRRKAGLSPRQEAHLLAYGYPYVMEEFRFHVTLSGALDPAQMAAMHAVLVPRLAPVLPRPCEITELALVGEAENGMFHLLHRFALCG